jgi:glycosyltransferase involved in cell wall biosynthesis
VVLAVPRRNFAHLAADVDPAVRLELMDWPRHRSPANARFLFALSRLVASVRPDVVHFLGNTTLWPNLAVPFWRGVPIVTTVHDVEAHPGDRETRVLPAWATSLLVRQSGHVIVHGRSLRERAVARFRKPRERVHVLSHPAIVRYAELAAREGMHQGPAPRPFTILMFGRIYAYKGLSTLVRAEALIGERPEGLRVVIAGRGDDPARCASMMGDPRRYDLRNRFVEDREVAALFTECDAVVLPYVEASQSGVLNVAASFGKPVIVTDVGELRATVEANGLGLVVPVEDPGALARAVVRLADDPGERAAFARNARAWAEGPNAPASVGAAAVALYRTIIDGAATDDAA